LGDDHMRLHLIRIFQKEGQITFKEEIVF